MQMYHNNFIFREVRMSLSRLMMVAAVAACMVFSASAKEPANCPMSEKGEHNDLAKLGLTADQKAKHDALHKEMLPIAKEHQKTVKDIRDKMKTEFLKANSDQYVLQGLSEQLQKENAAFATKRIDHLLKLKAILTPEQFAKVIDAKLSQCMCSGCCMENEKGEHGHERGEKEVKGHHHGHEGGEGEDDDD
jgi:Spy/CpxP family protein refolding chaperone